MPNKSLDEGRKIVKDLIKMHGLEKNILAIYTMGSFAENSINENSDIDLNIFVKKSDYDDLLKLKNAINSTEKKWNRRIDTNIISKKEIGKEVVNSLLSPHKYRHALLLFEIKYYNCLLYGTDLLKTIKINYDELPEEALKLLLTLGYRIRKIYLASGSLMEAKKQSIKFVTYACKFALIYKKIFLYRDAEVERKFLEEFSNLDNLEIVEECFRLKKSNDPITQKTFGRAVDFLERLSEKLLEDYISRKKWRRKI